ncbi:head maturation protease, ClpP-related [Paenibacillus sp. FSL R5-0887]|uniref:head maturation protease, ClpP-related n=1 Tax=Paenibacillus sp. FSL R5-0887 TaxID=2921662 RepID=UPI0030F9BDA7
MAKKIRLNGTVVGDRNAYIYEWLEIPHISPSSVSRLLEEANGEEIEVYISSGGGDAWAGNEIFTLVKEYSGFVTTKIPSIAGSAASVFAMAADKVLISPTGQIFIHNSATWTDGNKEDHQQTIQMLESVDEAMVNAYVLKTGKTREELRNLMKNETFFNAQRAVELGFADEIMFATEELNPTANLSMGAELPPDVLDKVRNKLLSMTPAKGGANSQIELTAAKAKEPKTADKTKEEPKTMDINELKEKHPELFAQVTGDAEAAERTRVAAITALAEKTPGSADLVKAAIANGETAGELAIKIVEASQLRISTAAKERELDVEESGIDTVKSLEAKTPNATKEEDAEAAVASMIAMAQNMKPKNGGRR